MPRIAKRAIARFDRLCSAYFDRRHPGPIARRILSALRPLVVRCAISDKWNLRWFVPLWLKGLKVPPQTPLARPKHIFMFCAHRGEFTLNLVLAVLLAWRGHRITLGYLPKLQSPIQPPLRPDHPSAKKWLKYALSDVERLSAGRIRTLDLTDGNVSGVKVDEELVRAQALPDSVMALRRETFDLGDPETRSVYEYMCAIGREAQRHLRAHFASNRYDRCLVPNGATFEGAHAYRIAVEFGMPVNTFEKFSFRGIRIINHDGDVTSWVDLEEVWKRRKELGYLEPTVLDTVRRRAAVLMEERKKGSTRLWATSLQRAAPQPTAGVLAEVGIPPGQRFVLVLPNVPYDAGYARLRTVFPSMREWLIQSVRFLLDSCGLWVIVRAHPAELVLIGVKERADQIIAEAGLRSERLVVLPAEAPVNSYALMEAADFGVVYSSTAGMEMAMLGKRVLVGAGVYYAGRGFTEDATNQPTYFEKLKRLATGGPAEPLSDSARTQCSLYYFLLHFAMQQPYPYDKPSGIKARPPAELLRTAQMHRYIDTLDVLCLDRTEFIECLERIHGARTVLSRLSEAH